MDLTHQRSYGLDLLRIFATLAVVILHLLGAGGVLGSLTPGSVRHASAWGLEVACSCAVNCYGLLSGYVGYGRSHGRKKLAVLWLQVALTSVLLTWGVGFFFQRSLTWKELLSPAMPVLTVQYWYFTAYFALYLLMPYLDRMLAGLDGRQSRELIIILALLFSVLPLLPEKDLFQAKAGYSFLWLAVLYLMGACVKRYQPAKTRPSWQYALGYALCMALALAGKLGGDYLSARYFPGHALGDKAMSYTSPAILLGSLFLLLLFRQVKVRGAVARRLIAFFAPLSFGVYIIHTNRMVWTYLLADHMVWAAQLTAPLLLLAVAGVALAIFLLCAGLDFLRLTLFRLCGKLLERRKVPIKKDVPTCLK